LFSSGWVLAGGQWKELGNARFTASSATWEAKETIDAGVDQGRFYLQTGGETKRTMQLNGKIERPAGEAGPPEVPRE